MGRRNTKYANRRKRELPILSSDDSGISLRGGTDLSFCKSPDLNERKLKMPKKHASAMNIETNEPNENIFISVQNHDNQSSMDTHDVPINNYSSVPGRNEKSLAIEKHFSFEIEESCLDYEPEDTSVINERTNLEDQLLNEPISFEGPDHSNDCNMQLPNPDDQTSDEMYRNKEAEVTEEMLNNLDDEILHSNHEDQTLYGDNEPPHNNDFLKNANVKYSGTNITIMRPSFNTEQTIPKPQASNQEEINSSNKQTNKNVKILLNQPVTNVSQNISKQEKKRDFVERVWSKTKLDLRDSRITSDDGIFSYARMSQNSEYSNSEISEQRLDYTSCSSVLDLSDKEAYEIFDNDSVFSEASYKTQVEASDNFEAMKSRNSKITYSTAEWNEGKDNFRCKGKFISAPPSTVEENISERSNFHTSTENDPELRVHKNDKQELVTRWLNSNDSSMGALIESLCESYFTFDCLDLQCSKSHLRPDEVEERIQQLSPQKLTETYKLVQGKMFLYVGLFSTFLECFKATPMMGRVMLSNMINDIFIVFNGTFIDKTIYVQKIVGALQDTGLSFKQAIDYIISRYGTALITLSDILLFIISKKTNLDENWCIVKSLISHRKENLDHEVVTNLLQAALNYPKNKELWEAIFNDIMEKNLVVLEKIPDTLWKKIYMLVPRAKENGTFSSHSPPMGSPDSIDQRSYSEFDEWTDRSNICDSATQVYDSSSSTSDNAEDSSSEHLQYADSQGINNTFSQNFGYVLSPFSNDRNLSDNQNPCYAAGIPYRNNYIQNGIPAVICQNSANTSLSDSVEYNSTNVFKIPGNVCVTKQIRQKRLVQAFGKRKSNSEKQLGSAYSEKMLNRINRTRNPPPRPETPANIVAHPTRNPLIDLEYQCNISLHNLYPRIHNGATEMSQSDLIRLKAALDVMNVEEFLEIFSLYQESYGIQNFILHTLTFLKNKNHKIDIYKQFVSLQNGIERIGATYMEDISIKMLIEVLAMNLIYLLEKKGKWDLCRSILLGMKKKDWHSLVTSKIFFCKSHALSHMWRYIFIIKIFVRAKDFHWANEIFQCNVLKLLEPTSNWPFQYTGSDIECRNEALNLFLSEGFVSNVVIVNDLMKHIAIVAKGTVEGLDIWMLFDGNICDIIDSENSFESILQLLYSDIIKYYGRYLSETTLQGYLIYMQDTISEAEAFRLYKYCCDRGVYCKYTGQEYVVTVGTRMSDFEINLLLKQYLENIANGLVNPHEFRIDLQLSEVVPESVRPEILKKELDRNAFSILASIIHILKIRYHVYVDKTHEMKIHVSRQMLESLSWK